MSLFDFLSDPPPPLKEKYKKALSHHYNNDKGVEKNLAKIQEVLDSEIQAHEDIIMIVYGDRWSKEFGILTNRRILIVDKKVKMQLPITKIAHFEPGQLSATEFWVRIYSYTALPYKNVDYNMLSSKDKETYNANQMNLYITTPVRAVIDQFLSTLGSALAGDFNPDDGEKRSMEIFKIVIDDLAKTYIDNQPGNLKQTRDFRIKDVKEYADLYKSQGYIKALKEINVKDSELVRSLPQVVQEEIENIVKSAIANT